MKHTSYTCVCLRVSRRNDLVTKTAASNEEAATERTNVIRRHIQQSFTFAYSKCSADWPVKISAYATGLDFDASTARRSAASTMSFDTIKNVGSRALVHGDARMRQLYQRTEITRACALVSSVYQYNIAIAIKPTYHVIVC